LQKSKKRGKREKGEKEIKWGIEASLPEADAPLTQK